MQLRFHSLAIPHTVTNRDYVACAYTQKVLKFADMMTARGHTVIHYGHERSKVNCAEHVTVTDDAVLAKAYGDHDWTRHQFEHSVNDYANQEFIRRCIPEIQARIQPYDFVLANWGNGHQAICNAVPSGIACEPGIGYTSGHFAQWRAYESHAVRNSVEGLASQQNWYSRVIPNYFDIKDFDYQPQKQNYVLYLGRVSELKGISTCIHATAAANVHLIIAGQGRISDAGWDHVPSHVTELGYADADVRRQLLAHAKAVIIATNYLEPFGGVVVEALLSGTPIITPHFGAFAEIQQPGLTGYLCYTLRDYVSALHNVDQIDPAQCRARGLEYSFDRVAPMFERWFADIHEVYKGHGWMSV